MSVTTYELDRDTSSGTYSLSDGNNLPENAIQPAPAETEVVINHSAQCLVFVARCTMHVRSEQWFSATRNDLVRYASGRGSVIKRHDRDPYVPGESYLDHRMWKSGGSGLWLQPRIYPLIETAACGSALVDNETAGHRSAAGTGQPILWFDVESRDNHGSVQANIEAARTFRDRIVAHGLAENMTICLSGSGFRFMWPYCAPNELVQQFEMIFSRGSLHEEYFPCVDSGTIKVKTRFFRLFAKRTIHHVGSGKDPDGRSQYVLRSVNELDTLTEEQYLELVTADPDPAIWFEQLNSLLPTSTTSLPEVWRQYIQDAHRHCELVRAIDQPSFGRGSYSTGLPNSQVSVGDAGLLNDETFIRLLDEKLHQVGGRTEGIFTNNYDGKDSIFLRLSHCPECGESEGNPVIYPSGYLYCLRNNNCPFQGQPTRPDDWLDGWSDHRREIDATDPMVTAEPPQTSLCTEEARTLIRQSLSRADGSQNRLIRVTPGVGKTYAAREYMLEHGADQLILFTSQEQRVLDRLADELENDPRIMDGRIPFNRLMARRGDESSGYLSVAAKCGTYLCQRHELGESNFHNHGVTHAISVCPTCEEFSTCGYRINHREIEQQRSGIILSTHKGAIIHHNKFKHITTWILDEDPSNDLIGDTSLLKFKKSMGSLRQLSNHISNGPMLLTALNKLIKTHDKVREIFQAVRVVQIAAGKADVEYFELNLVAGGDVIVEGVPTRQGLWQHVGVSTEERQALQELVSFMLQWESGDDQASLYRMIFAKGINLGAIRWLAAALGTPGYTTRTAVLRAHVKKGLGIEVSASITGAAVFSQQLPGQRHIILDATAHAPSLESFFPGLEVLDVSVALTGPRIFIETGATVSDIRKGGGIREIIRLVQTAVATPEFGGPKSVLLALPMLYGKDRIFMDEDRQYLPNPELVEALHSHWPPEQGWSWNFVHFGSARAINEFKNVEAVIATDYRIPQSGEVRVQFESLGLRSSSQLASAHQAKQQGEVIQAIHRIRPAVSPKVVVFCGRRWMSELGSYTVRLQLPRPGRDRVNNMDSKPRAINRLLSVVGETHCLDRRIAHLSGVHIDAISSEPPVGVAPTLSQTIMRALAESESFQEYNEPIVLSRKRYNEVVKAIKEETGLESNTLNSGKRGKPEVVLGTYEAASECFPGLSRGAWK